MSSIPKGYSEIGNYAKMFRPLLETLRKDWKVVLASSSKQRQEMLKTYGLEVEILEPKKPEIVDTNLSPAEIVKKIALEKANEVWPTCCSPKTILISADTMITQDGEIFGKPKDENDAYAMLKRFSGKLHEVFTGVAVLTEKHTINFVDSTKVYFSNLSDDEIRSYINTGEYRNKAGSYAIQGLGSKFVENMEGDYYTVIGIPLCRLSQELNSILESSKEQQ